MLQSKILSFTVGSMSLYVSIKKADAYEQIVFAEVYAPDIPDTDNEYMTAEEIKKAAYNFVKEGRIFKVDTNHDNEENGSYVVESFIARKGDPDFIEGSWVVGIHIPDEKVWKQVMDGELNGFSLEAAVLKTPQEVEVEIPAFVHGGTSENDSHSHTFKVDFDVETGDFKGGVTDTVNGHFHTIKRGTITEDAEGHNHRFSYVELMYG